MSVETDRRALAELDEWDIGKPLPREHVGAVLRALAREDAPPRFALYAISEDAYGCDGEIIAWGLDIEDSLVVHSPCGRFRGSFQSTTSMLRILGVREDVRLVWLDPTAP
ncbi:hypothetical protein EV191_10321 [Tamaricihabitans halophyticus]|uniref:Uncharacterized protein n=1 Tax=Tamaricihabitans halophyticus TaxID=1262583 RepID=A0A4R2R3A4_9PSEU|nr:hypothetical protein [Tamaricihabitans halophyticus]TCP53981.1 hypothetical protein EV191_10321 [Tamaricihabitans halophyticus]